MAPTLYDLLIAAGVFQEPAAEIAAIFADADPDQIMAAFDAHVRETQNIRIAVWRLLNGILETEADKVRATVARTQNPTRRDYGAQ